MGINEREFLDKMVALAKAGEDQVEHLKCVFYTWAEFFEADTETADGIAELLADAAGAADKEKFKKDLLCIL